MCRTKAGRGQKGGACVVAITWHSLQPGRALVYVLRKAMDVRTYSMLPASSHSQCSSNVYEMTDFRGCVAECIKSAEVVSLLAWQRN